MQQAGSVIEQNDPTDMTWHRAFMTSEQRTQKDEEDKKAFRIKNKRLFLTYPQCPAT